jgi:hypothetical protein
MLSLLVLLSVAAAAEPVRPAVTPFPLHLRRTPTGFSLNDAELLQRAFLQKLATVAQVADGQALDRAVTALGRDDCDRQDDCLRQLAGKGETLYAIDVAVGLSMTGEVFASGRLVRDDGEVISAPRRVAFQLGQAPFLEAATLALSQLVDELNVVNLPATRKPIAPAVVETEAAPEAPSDQAPSLAKKRASIVHVPQGPPRDTRRLRGLGYALLGLGVAVGVTGAVLFGLGTGNTGLDLRNFVIDRATYVASQQNQLSGVIMLAVGIAAAAGGGVVLYQFPSMTLAPTVSPSGAGVVFSGAF